MIENAARSLRPPSPASRACGAARRARLSPPLVTAFNTVTDQLFVLLGDAVNRMRTAYQNNPYLARVLGEAVAGAARTNTFLGERYRRLARRRGNKKAIVAVGRSLLVIIWHLLANPDTDFIRPRRRLPRHPRQHPTRHPQPHPTPASPRLHRHPPPRRLTRPQPVPAPLRSAGTLSHTRSPVIFELAKTAADTPPHPLKAGSGTARLCHCEGWAVTSTATKAGARHPCLAGRPRRRYHR